MAQYPDRFIPKRSAMDIDYSCYLLNQKGPKPIIVESTDSEVVNSAKRSQNQNNYISVLTFSRSDLLPLRLKKAIFGNNRQKWVLQFSSRPLRKRDSPESFRCLSDVWPVKPRSKPLLKNPSIILDLPDIQDHLDCSSPLDWAATGYIATVYENEVHFWHPEGRRMEATYTSMRVGKCLKWNRQGNLLAFALEYPHCKYATWSIQLQKKISISWHPWREGLLAVGQAQGVSIWNVNNLTVVGHIVCYSIDAIAFNPVSAELLISAHNNLPDNTTRVYLTVMKNCEKAVDEVVHCNGREPFLYWDTTGTKLAVVGSHESLCIWDFFGTSSNGINKKTKRSRLTSDPFETMKLIGPTIR
ncbi:unnamed protein product [Acanthoscelides obtectus]|uniref:Uncharacterized protein n=1 Tax=Acanthoscelides obtectus TaxID=200917 RepID=A0A9P0LR82_ACAOB|nr:unnamed protein product [Acanthoscelides obtectus]CAK1646920.1 Cell division cycle 20.3, cofactor of APC complex [Acanthoscelides obtectus]